MKVPFPEVYGFFRDFQKTRNLGGFLRKYKKLFQSRLLGKNIKNGFRKKFGVLGPKAAPESCGENYLTL